MWFASGLGALDTLSVIATNSLLISMNRGGLRADAATARKKLYGKWWLALLVSTLSVPFVIASAVMPLCLQMDVLGVLAPNYLAWVVVVTKCVQCCVPAVVWALASNCRFEHVS